MNFIDEFKDLWKMKGTYFFVTNELLDTENPLFAVLCIKIGQQMAEKRLYGQKSGFCTSVHWKIIMLRDF